MSFECTTATLKIKWRYQRGPYCTAWSDRRTTSNAIYRKKTEAVFFNQTNAAGKYVPWTISSRREILLPVLDGVFMALWTQPNFSDLQVLAPYWKTRWQEALHQTSHPNRSKTTINKRKKHINALQVNWRKISPLCNDFSLAYLPEINANQCSNFAPWFYKKSSSAIIILPSTFSFDKKVNINEDCRHIYLLGQPLTNLCGIVDSWVRRSVSLRI